MLTRIFSPISCAQCRLCCHFSQRSVWETPFLEPKLAADLSQQGIEFTCRLNGAKSFALHYRTNNPEESCNCPLLDPALGCTLPRAQRPFECRIWPIRLMHDAHGNLCIACYKQCSALLSEDTWKALVNYATGDLLPQLLDYATRFPESIRAWDDHYTIIWTQ